MFLPIPWFKFGRRVFTSCPQLKNSKFATIGSSQRKNYTKKWVLVIGINLKSLTLAFAFYLKKHRLNCP